MPQREDRYSILIHNRIQKQNMIHGFSSQAELRSNKSTGQASSILVVLCLISWPKPSRVANTFIIIGQVDNPKICRTKGPKHSTIKLSASTEKTNISRISNSNGHLLTPKSSNGSSVRTKFEDNAPHYATASSTN